MKKLIILVLILVDDQMKIGLMFLPLMRIG